MNPNRRMSMSDHVGPHSAEDYAAFVGNNVHKFLPKFSKYIAEPTSFHPGWNWAAFFFSFWWFLYRKMYLWSVICFITLCLPYFNLLIAIGWGIAANSLYFKQATAKIAETKAFHGDSYRIYLSDAGGVNGWVPWVALLVTGAFFLLLMLGIIGAALIASA